MFKISDNKFTQYLNLSEPISEDFFNTKFIQYFDNDGFELSLLEQEYYRKNRVPVNDILNHACDQRLWIEGGDNNFIIDHSMILQRWNFTGEAREQLEDFRVRFPYLNKYLNLQPKWGIDFSLEYYNDKDVLEVIHIEMDYRNYREAEAAREVFEEKILSTDWYDFTNQLIRNKDKWTTLNGIDQNDWKAAYWGLKKSEKIFKAFEC
jgi:hypothetical protein